MVNRIVNALKLGKEVYLNVWQDDIETDVSLRIDDISFELDDDSDIFKDLYQAEEQGLIEAVDKNRGYGKMKLKESESSQ